MTTPVVTELVISARGAEAGSAAYVRAMDAAQKAVDRVIDRSLAAANAIDKQTAVMVGGAQSTNRVAASFDRLKASIDPAFASAKAFERDMLSLDNAVNRLGISETEQARILDMLVLKHDAVAQAAARQAAEYVSLAAAARAENAAEAAQAGYNSRLGVRDITSGGARDSAAVFAAAGAEADALAASVARVRAQIDPLGVAQDRYNAELAEFAMLASKGAISTEQLAQAEAHAKQKLDATTQAINGQTAALSRSTRATANASYQTTYMVAQFQDIGVTAAMGMAPLMIALQQGTQLSAAIAGEGVAGLKGLGTGLLALLSPVNLLTIGFVGLAAVGIQWAMSLVGGADQANKALEEHDKWLETILAGYGVVREAAKKATEEALKLPQAAVESNVAADLEKQTEQFLKQVNALKSLSAIDLDFESLMSVGAEPSDFDAIRAKVAEIVAFQQALSSTNPDLDEFVDQLTKINNSKPPMVVKMFVEDLLRYVEAARATNVLMAGNKAALDEFAKVSDIREFMPGVADAIARISRETEDLRTEKQQLDAAFQSDAAGARTIGELNALVNAYVEMERAAKAAAWAIANSGEAAVVTASQYGTATGAANAYANALWALGSAIPAVARAQGAFQQLQAAESEYTLGLAANKALIDGRAISMDEFIRRQDAVNDRYAQAQDAISGVSAAEEDLATIEAGNRIDSMQGRDQALARVTQQYEDRAKAIAELATTGADNARIEALLAENSDQLTVALGNTNAQFDRMAATSGAKEAGKALKDAEKDFKSFLSIANQLAEKAFPGEYALREAQELISLLDQYGAALDDVQRAAVEARIADQFKAASLGVRELDDSVEDVAKTIEDTLGSALGSLFDGPLEDADAFFDKLLSGFAQIGQANLSKLFEGTLSGTGGAEGGIAAAVQAGAAAGTKEGAMGGLNNFFKQAGINTGTAGAASAGIGGLGIGYQTQDPVMGALGGALAGFAAGGPIGAVIGGIAGLVGGIFGMNKALKEARQQLEQNRAAIEQFIDAGKGIETTQFAKALSDYNKQAEEYIKLAQKAKDYDLVAQIEDAMNSIVGTLGKAFREDLGRSIAELRGNGYLNDVADAQERYNNRLKDAALLGVSADGALTEFQLTIRNIAMDSDLTAAQLANLIKKFPFLREEIAKAQREIDITDQQARVETARGNLREAYEREADALSSVVDRTKAFIASLADFRAGLKLDDKFSTLSPEQKMIEARRQFNLTAQLARSGDADAQARLQGASTSYLDAAQGYYGSSTNYQAIFDQVDRVLGTVLGSAGNQLTGAEAQLAAANLQISKLSDINASVLTVAQGIKELREELRKLQALQRDQVVATNAGNAEVAAGNKQARMQASKRQG